MKDYILLAAASIICFILAFSALTVAIGLLSLETYKTVVAAYNVSAEGFNYLIETWEFVRYNGAF